MCNRGKEHHLGSAFTIRLHVAVVVNQLAQFITILAESPFSSKGLVVAEHDEDHIRLDILEILILGGEAPVSGTAPNGVTSISKVTDSEIVLRIGRMENSLQPAIVLHTIRQATPDDADAILLLEGEGGRSGLHIRKPNEGSEGGNPQGKERACRHGFQSSEKGELRQNLPILTPFLRKFQIPAPERPQIALSDDTSRLPAP